MRNFYRLHVETEICIDALPDALPAAEPALPETNNPSVRTARHKRSL